MTQSEQHYSLPAKIFHWGFLALFAYGIYKQVDELEQLQDQALLRFEIIFAAIFLALLVLRFVYMKKTQSSFVPKTMPLWQVWAAKAVHYAM